MIFENSSDVIALITCVGTVAVSVIAAVRYSRCVRIKCCCIECDRKLNSKPENGENGENGENDRGSPQSPPAGVMQV
jgi:hypothetical protein